MELFPQACAYSITVIFHPVVVLIISFLGHKLTTVVIVCVRDDNLLAISTIRDFTQNVSHVENVMA